MAQIAQSARAATGRPQSTVLRPVGIAPYGECPTPEVLATSATSETCVSPHWDAKQVLALRRMRRRLRAACRGRGHSSDIRDIAQRIRGNNEGRMGGEQRMSIFSAGSSRLEGVRENFAPEHVQHVVRNHGFSFVAAPNSLGNIGRAHQYGRKLTGRAFGPWAVWAEYPTTQTAQPVFSVQ